MPKADMNGIASPRYGTAEWHLWKQFSRSLTLGIGELSELAMPLLEWTQKYRANLTPDRRFDLVQHYYLKEIYEETESRVRVIYKSSQMGASEYAISFVLHACDSRNATVLYIFPTDAHVSDFSSARIGPAIEASDYLRRIVIDWRTHEGLRGADRVTLKRIRNRFLYLRGSRVKTGGQAPQLKAIDADIVVLDEIDEMDYRAPAIAEKRTGHSLIAEQLWISTPTYAGFGIHAQWLKSDQREWNIPCPHCGKYQVLTIDHCVQEWDSLERPVRWHGWPDNAWMACGKCGKKLDKLTKGIWIPENPGSEIAGWHLTKLFSPMTNLLDIVKSLETTEETRRKEIFNQDLGLPHTPMGNRMTAETLDNCRKNIQIPEGRTFMGVDVGTLLNVVIRSPADPETGFRVPLYIGAVDDFQSLGNLVRQYNVGTCIIDALPETRKAREFQKAFPYVVWLAYYVGQKVGSREIEPVVWNQEKGVVVIDRTRMIDKMFSRFFEKVNTLPEYARDIPDYYEHLTAPVRIIEKNVATYINSKPDHFAHAETYCAAASEGFIMEVAGEQVNIEIEQYLPETPVTIRSRNRPAIAGRRRK